MKRPKIRKDKKPKKTCERFHRRLVGRSRLIYPTYSQPRKTPWKPLFSGFSKPATFFEKPRHWWQTMSLRISLRFFPEQLATGLRKKQALQINFNSARTGTEIVHRSGCQDISSGFRLLFQSVGQNAQSIVRDNTACVKKRFHQQQMAKTFSATAWTLIKTSARMRERRSYLATCSPDSEFEDWMDDTVEVDDSLTLLRLWMSAIWSDNSSTRRRRYLDIKFIFLVVFFALGWFFQTFPFLISPLLPMKTLSRCQTLAIAIFQVLENWI